MQTFITTYDLEQNAKVLDDKRLFKQLLEGYQILNTIVNDSQWRNHPAVRQWKQHPNALLKYIESIWNECQQRQIAVKSELYHKSSKLIDSQSHVVFPEWWNNEEIAKTHRGRLKCKGIIDAHCTDIKKHYKIKSIDAWLKTNFKKTKNQLKYSDVDKLKSYLTPIPQENRSPNYYDQFNWSESPALEYIWPL